MATKNRCSDRKMKCLIIFKFLFLHSAFQTIYRIVEGVEGHAQAFIQTDSDLQYLVDGVSIHVQQQGLTPDTSTVSFSDTENENIQTYTNMIGFHPPFLDFKLQPVGIPYIKKVTVHNPSTVNNLHMLSISGSTVHFHCSFFLEKVIEPGGNTTFDVVFLSREEGPVENTLFIHTSLGSFKYKVQGQGAPNLYRLRPFLGARVPLNSSYTPLIKMHNPHSQTLQVMEMYSSGGDLHLELINGESEAPVQLWEIQPYETKSVMRASFVARKENNHTAYIRIKTNISTEPYLVIPVEVEVSSDPGIYSPIEILDFGVIRSDEDEIRLTVNIINSGKKHIQITSVVVSPVNEAVSVEFKPIKISPDTFHPSEVAVISFRPSKVQNQKQCAGKIFIKSKNNQFKLSLPYKVNLLHGLLKYDRNVLQFYVNPTNTSYSRILNVTNLFNSTIVIFNVTLSKEAKPYFKVLNFKKIVLHSGDSVKLVQITFKTNVTDLQLSSYIELRSNFSEFRIPLICYTGKLKTVITQSSQKEQLEFGTLGMGEKRSLTFILKNNNKVQVLIQKWTTNMTRTRLICIGVQKNSSNILNVTAANKTIMLGPSDGAIFKVEVTAPSEENKYFGEVFIKTIYEVIKIPFSFTAAKGSLNSFPEVMVFDNAFPGKISSQSLHIESTFSQSMHIASIKASPADPRFYYLSGKTSKILNPEAKTNIGKLYFDGRKLCKVECYTGLPTNTAKGHKWLTGLSLPPDVALIDQEIHRSLLDNWNDVKSLQADSINVTLRLDTEEVQGFLLHARANLKWPLLSSKRKIKFPLTQIGNVSVKELTLENPASVPILVQVLTLPVYPNQQLALDMMNEIVADHLSDLIETENKDLFILKDLEKYEKSFDNPIPLYRSSVESYFGVKANKDSVVMLLTPGMRVKLRVGFTPFDDRIRSSLLLIRNNLTVLDTVVIEGQGGYGEMKFGNKKPGAESSLVLEMTEKHLADCGRDNSQSKFYPLSRFTVKRLFTARNTGELPVYVSGFYINNSPCQGYGFKILNCNSFLLQPNSSHKVDIAFTPDFTLTKVERILSIQTSLSSEGKLLNYSLVATVPASMLESCADSLPRSQWEPYLYYMVIILMVFMLFCVFATAYFESDRILRSTYVAMAITSASINTDPNIGKARVFDLKTLGSKSFNHKKSSSKRIEANGTVPEKSEIVNNTYKFPFNLFFRKKNKSSKKSESSVKSSENGAVVNSCADNNKSKYSVLSDKIENGDITENIKTCSGGRKKSRTNKDEMLDLGSYNDPGPTKDDGKKSVKTSPDFKSWSNLFHCRGSSNDISLSKEPIDVENSSLNKIDKVELNEEAVGVHDYASSNQILEMMDKDTQSKWLTKSKNKKKKMHVHDADMLKSFVKKSQNFEEETSSTTTETSNADSENSTEKEPKIIKEKMKPRHRPSNRNSNVLNKYENKMISVKGVDDDGENDNDFELSTKSKAHKKIKIDSSKVFGGDILKPSTLELPYKLKPVKLDKDVNENKSKSKETTSVKTNGKKKVKSGNVDANGLSGSSRSSSYSSIVSSNGESKASKSGKKSEKHPGPVGQKPPCLATNPWSLSDTSSAPSNVYGATPSCGSDTLDTFYLPPIQEGSGSSATRDMIPPLNSFNFGADESFCGPSDTYTVFTSPTSPNPWDGISAAAKPMTMMQALQAERRQRMEDYRKQQAYRTDWPGFDIPKVGDNLWDPNYTPQQNGNLCDAWPVVSPTQQDNTRGGLWSSLKGGVWNPVSSFWTNNNEAKPDLGNPIKLRSDEVKENFDPFHTLSSIWSPSNNATSVESSHTNNAWSTSFFTENNQSDRE